MSFGLFPQSFLPEASHALSSSGCTMCLDFEPSIVSAISPAMFSKLNYVLEVAFVRDMHAEREGGKKQECEN